MQQNMQLSNGSQLVISGLVEWQDAHYRIPGDLVFDPAGGELRIKRCAIVVAGDVVLGPNSLLHISDSELSLDNAFPRQHEFRWEGGHLHTERTVVGGNKIGGTVRISPFWLNSGYWFAKDTTVRYSGGIQLGWGRAGYHGLPGQRGGTLRAVGLSGGESADALHLSGWGNAELSDSVFAIGLSV